MFGATGFGREVTRRALETGAQLGLEVHPHECTPGLAAAVASTNQIASGPSPGGSATRASQWQGSSNPSRAEPRGARTSSTPEQQIKAVNNERLAADVKKLRQHRRRRCHSRHSVRGLAEQGGPARDLASGELKIASFETDEFKAKVNGDPMVLGLPEPAPASRARLLSGQGDPQAISIPPPRQEPEA